jgi:hypothetical protein
MQEPMPPTNAKVLTQLRYAQVSKETKKQPYQAKETC